MSKYGMGYVIEGACVLDGTEMTVKLERVFDIFYKVISFFSLSKYGAEGGGGKRIESIREAEAFDASLGVVQ